MERNNPTREKKEDIRILLSNELIFPFIASGEAGPGFASLVKSLSKETLELANENAFSSMTHAIKARGQLACYAAIAMTNIGTRLVHLTVEHVGMQCVHKLSFISVLF